MESHSLSERTHELNVRTSILNDKIRELNETSTKAACANLAAAAKTSNSTRVNVEVCTGTLAKSPVGANSTKVTSVHYTLGNGPPILWVRKGYICF